MVYDQLARQTPWSPIGERVAITVEDSGDERLTKRSLYEIVRACSVRGDGTPTDLVIELDETLHYHGHRGRVDLRWLVARPCFQWRRMNRLLLTWAAVRIIDARALVDATHDRTIGTARIRRA